MWSLSRNSVGGRVTAAWAMLASPGLAFRRAKKAGLPPRRVAPLSLKASFGLKPRSEQLAAWKRLEGDAEESSAGLTKSAPVPRRSVVIAKGSQLVGLRVKSRAVDEDPDLADVEGDAVEDRRDRVRAGRVDVDLGVVAVDPKGRADDDGADVEGAGLRRGDHRDQSGAPL